MSRGLVESTTNANEASRSIVQRREALARVIFSREAAAFSRLLDEKIAEPFEPNAWGTETLRAIEAALLRDKDDARYFSGECLEYFCYVDIQLGSRQGHRLFLEQFEALRQSPPSETFELALWVPMDDGLRRVYFFRETFDPQDFGFD